MNEIFLMMILLLFIYGLFCLLFFPLTNRILKQIGGVRAYAGVCVLEKLCEQIPHLMDKVDLIVGCRYFEKQKQTNRND